MLCLEPWAKIVGKLVLKAMKGQLTWSLICLCKHFVFCVEMGKLLRGLGPKSDIVCFNLISFNIMVNSDTSHAYPLISRTQWLLLLSLSHINIVLEVHTKTEGWKTTWPVFVDDRTRRWQDCCTCWKQCSAGLWRENLKPVEPTI